MTNKQSKVLDALKEHQKEQIRQYLNIVGILIATFFVAILLPKFIIPEDNLFSNTTFVKYLNNFLSLIIKLFPVIAAAVLFVILIILSKNFIQLNKLKKEIEETIDPDEIDKILLSTSLSYILDELDSTNR